MPEVLLPECLESADVVAESLEKVEDALRGDLVTEKDLEKVDDDLRDNANKIGRFLEGMKGTALAFDNAWRKIITNVAKGRTAEMQAERTGLLNEFEKWLDILKKGYALLTRENKQGWTDLDPDFLLSEIAGMERLKDRVFDRWKSAEDLEDLAARDYPLTTADLDQIGPQRRPPVSWKTDKAEAQKKLARAHYTIEPGITAIFTICTDAAHEALPTEPIKLLEVNENTIPSGIMPLGFDPSPANGIAFSSIIIEVTPEELERIRRNELKLPEGWSLGSLISRSDPPNGNE